MVTIFSDFGCHFFCNFYTNQLVHPICLKSVKPSILKVNCYILLFILYNWRKPCQSQRSKVGNCIADQIIRSGTSPPVPNYGEAQSAESRSDFVHKMKICLKELRETKVWLRIIVKTNLISPSSKLDSLLDENNQLISIFVSSIKTADQKGKKVNNYI